MLASLEKRDIMDLQKEIEELENDAEEKEQERVDAMMEKIKQAADPRIVIRKKLDKIKNRIKKFTTDDDWGNQEPGL